MTRGWTIACAVYVLLVAVFTVVLFDEIRSTRSERDSARAEVTQLREWLYGPLAYQRPHVIEEDETLMPASMAGTATTTGLGRHLMATGTTTMLYVDRLAPVRARRDQIVEGP